MTDNSIGKALYKLGTSESPMKRQISKSLTSIIEASGAKERTTKINKQKILGEKEALNKFLNATPTIITLKNLQINTKLFMVTIYRLYPFNTNKFDNFLRGFIALKKELEDNIKLGKKLNPARYEDVIMKVIDYKSDPINLEIKGDPITKERDYVILEQGSEDITSTDLLMEMIDNNMSDMQIGGYCYREMKKLRRILSHR